jgi:hypothetical protein
MNVPAANPSTNRTIVKRKYLIIVSSFFIFTPLENPNIYPAGVGVKMPAKAGVSAPY